MRLDKESQPFLYKMVARDYLTLVGLLGAFGLIVTSYALSLGDESAGSAADTSPTTIVEPSSYFNSIDTRAASPPATSDTPTGLGVLAECALNYGQNTGVTIAADSPNVYKPLISKLPKRGSDSVFAEELDRFSWGPNGNEAEDVGLENGFYLTTSGDNVYITNAGTGYDVPLPASTGHTSPDGHFSLPPGNYATGNFGLIDYSIENSKGNFYLEVYCDAQKEENLINYDETNEP
ncbi:MAG TPA: hypothetical protein VGF75_06965 [Candidatus Saccharimonadales bacterium]|jgi:hypothetical protein